MVTLSSYTVNRASALQKAGKALAMSLLAGASCCMQMARSGGGGAWRQPGVGVAGRRVGRVHCVSGGAGAGGRLHRSREGQVLPAPAGEWAPGRRPGVGRRHFCFKTGQRRCNLAPQSLMLVPALVAFDSSRGNIRTLYFLRQQRNQREHPYCRLAFGQQHSY